MFHCPEIGKQRSGGTHVGLQDGGIISLLNKDIYINKTTWYHNSEEKV
jgi:hypothetical protein